MRKFIYLSIYLSLHSCKSQNFPIIDSKNSDIIIVTTTLENVNFIHNTIYNKGGLILLKRIRARYNYEKRYSEVTFQFTKNKDTMNINCICGQDRNYFFKDLNFQKGNYEFSFDGKREKIFGTKIRTSEEIQNILFRNTYVADKKPVMQDVHFKELEFYEIDLKDTINVKLEKIKALLE